MNNQDLKKFLNEHFIYEVEMLLYAGSGLAALNSKNPSHINAINLALEGVVSHGRNLVEFLYDEVKYDDDARAFQFVGRKHWLKSLPKETDSIKKLRKRASKEMAHLTYKRIAGTPPEKGWFWAQTIKDIQLVVEIFLDLLPEKYIDTGIQNLKQVLKAI